MSNVAEYASRSRHREQELLLVDAVRAFFMTPDVPFCEYALCEYLRVERVFEEELRCEFGRPRPDLEVDVHRAALVPAG